MTPDDRPDWVARLGATPCDAASAQWEGWTASVTTYCVTFDALGPKRNAQEWRDNWRDEYGKVILRPSEGSGRSVAEFELVKAFRAAGWGARWNDTFRSAPAWMLPWTQVDDVPRAALGVLANIRAASPTAKSWDVLAWRDDSVMFVECKAPKEKFTKSEQAFIWGAGEVGIPLDQFAVVRGAINFPETHSELSGAG